MRKALLVTLQFPPQFGGVQTYLHGVARHVPSEWIDVMAPGEMKKEIIEDGVRITRTAFTTNMLWPHWIPLFFKLLILAFRRKYSLLIAGQVLPVGMAVLLVSKLTKVPYAVFAHGMDVLISQNSPRKRKISKKIFASAVRVFCPSEYTRKLVISQGVLEARCMVVHPCIDTSSIARITEDMRQAVRNKFGIRKTTLLLTVARLVKRKGHIPVLRTLANIRGKVPDYQYIIVGEGPMEQAIDAEIKRLSLENVVVRTSSVDPRTLDTLYDIADIFVLPVMPDPEGQDVEGFGIVYQEALVRGVAVVASNSGGVPDAVGDAANLIDPGNIQQLEAALTTLIMDPAEREALAERGRRLISQRTWEHELIPLTELVRHTV